MATDARGHTVPAAADHPQRSDLLSLSLTTNGFTTVADTTARTAYIAALAAATPAQTVSTSKPAIVYRTDAAAIELSVDGTNWFVVPTRFPQTYTPTWSGSTTNPTLGNGTLVGNYTVDDQFVDFEILLTLGSTTTNGSGNYTLTLPVAPNGAARRVFVGTYFAGSPLYPILAVANGATTTLNLYNIAAPVTNVSSSSPASPASGYTYHVAGRYRK